MVTGKGKTIMSDMLTTGQPQVWLPTFEANLVINPLRAASVAMQATGGQKFAPQRTHDYAVPTVTADPTVAWLEEGDELATTSQTLGEDRDHFHKVGGLVVISREMARDTNPDVAEQIGEGLAAAIAHKIDAAYFGTRADSTTPPRGLGDITGITTTPGTYTDLDAFSEAILNAASVGSNVNTWVCNTNTATRLVTLKTGEGSAQALLHADPTGQASTTIAGRPLLISDTIADNTVFGLPHDGSSQIIVREDIEVESDGSVYFTRDKVVIKATARVTTVYPHAAAIQEILLTD